MGSAWVAPAEFHYRLSFPARSAVPGAHRGSRTGGGLEFIGHDPFLNAPDARRLDLRASLQRPLQDWVVRRYRQRSAATVWVVADLSASTGFAGSHRRLDEIARLVESASISAVRGGDRFGFVGCDETIRDEWVVAASRTIGAARDVAERLRTLAPTGRSAAGLEACERWIGVERSLVFLVSDFHFPLDLLDRTLAALARHDVVPVALWDRRELDPGPGTRLITLTDPETRTRRTLLLRPSLRARMVAAAAARVESIEAVCSAHGRDPLFMADGFDAEAVTRHFFSQGSGVR